MLGLLAPPVPAASPLVTETIHFEVLQTDVIPFVAAFRASCDINATGEALSVPANATIRTTVSAEPGPCAMTLVLFGIDVPISTIPTTPLGQNSIYIPGVSIVTLGVVDISLDLRTSMNSTTRVEDPVQAAVSPDNHTWTQWGVVRLDVDTGGPRFGSLTTTALNTTFTYRVVLSLTVLALGVPIFQANLVDLGAHDGVPALVTPLLVDLLPSPPNLNDPAQVTHDGATLSWSTAGEDDIDHLEVWVADPSLNVSYRLEGGAATGLRVPLRPLTTYRAWVVAVDTGGQSSPSRIVTFTTTAEPADGTDDGPVGPQAGPPWTWIAVALVVGFAILGTLIWSSRRPPKE